MPVLIIDGLHRDVLRNRVFRVTVTGKGEPEKSLGLPVPFDCQLDSLKAETEKAVKALGKELESATIEGHKASVGGLLELWNMLAKYF